MRVELAGIPPGPLELRVMDALGRTVRQLEGWGHELLWNGRDGAGRLVAPGVYRLEVRTEQGSVARAVTRVR